MAREALPAPGATGADEPARARHGGSGAGPALPAVAVPAPAASAGAGAGGAAVAGSGVVGTAPAARHDGFTPARQRVFLEALADTASVADATRAAGVSRNTAYRRRAEPDAEAFRLAWAAALAQAFDRLVDTAFDRAVNGVEQPVYWRGEQIGTRTWHNDRLLMFLLRRRGDFSPTVETWGREGISRAPLYPLSTLNRTLDLVAPAPPPGAAGPAAADAGGAGEADRGPDEPPALVSRSSLS